MQSHLRAEGKLLAQESFESCQAAGIYVLESMVLRLCIYRQSPQCTKDNKYGADLRQLLYAQGKGQRAKGRAPLLIILFYLVSLPILSDLFP